MEEKLISFETAKLAKEKGFNILCRDFYPDLSWNSNEIYHSIDIGYNEFFKDDGSYGDVIYAPTQSLLQKWLREVHEIYVSVHHHLSLDFKDIQYYTNWGFINNPKSRKTMYGGVRVGGGYDEKAEWKTYEEALESALKYALRLI